MATDHEKTALPGDVIQDSNGQLMLVTIVKKWGVGAVQQWHDGLKMNERYHRLKPGTFYIVGAARLLPESVSRARRDAMITAAAISGEGE